MKTLKGLLLSLGTTALLAACGGQEAERAASTEDTNQEANETENKTATEDSNVSGALTFYTSQPDADAEALVSAFNEEYPDVDVDIFRSGTEEVISKVQAENEAGDVQADLLLVADAVTFERLKEQDLLLAYESPEAKGISEEFIDPDHMYYGTKLMATILAVNTNNVENIPDSWKVLTSEEAMGEAIMPSPLYSGAAAYNIGVMSRKNEFGWEFFEEVHNNDVTVVQGNGSVLQSVANGEKSYGMVVDFIVARAKTEGSPVELVYPKEGVPVITEPIGIMKNSENKEAAKAFVDFVLSEKGQEVSAQFGYTPVREDIDVPEGLKGSNEIDVLSHDVQQLLNGREDDKQTFTQLLGE